MAESLLATVVVTVKDDRRIYRLLASLFKQTVPQHMFEIVVVENGSSKFADVATLADGRVHYLTSGDANMASARNVGLRAAKGRYLLFTDADCVVQPDWIARMTEKLEEGRYVAVGGRIGKFPPKTWTQRYAITIVGGQAELNYLPALALPYVVGANAGFVKAAVLDIGGFDERFRSGSDVDICYRLGLRGYEVGLAPEAEVLHEDRPHVFAHFNRFRYYAVYQVLLFRTYRHVSGRRFLINKYPLKRAWTALLAIPHGSVRLLGGDLAPTSRALLQLVEAIGIWTGDIQGSIRYRQFYI